MDWRHRLFAALANPASSATDREAALELKQENTPQRLFRYQPLNDKSLSTLEKPSVWLSPPRVFNDPFDSAVTFSMAKVFENIEAAPKTGHRSELFKLIQGDASSFAFPLRDTAMEHLWAFGDSFSRTVSDHWSQELRDRLGVCCMSESGTGVPMWAHYADKHRGFCIEWDTSTWPDSLLRNHLFPVIYNENPPDTPFLHIRPHFDGAPALLAMWKSPEWSYEREWRLVAWKDPIGDGRALSLSKPVAVHAGLMMTPADLEWLKVSCDKLGVPVRQVRTDPAVRRIYLTPPKTKKSPP